VAEVDGQVIGYAYGSPHRERAAYASSCDVAVYVDPAHARQGLGRALYAALFPLLSARGAHAAFAGIALPNAASVGLHEAMGFTPVGIYREVGWKLGGWRDVGWWQRLL
jgi:phosphinothricin acetyltransferase